MEAYVLYGTPHSYYTGKVRPYLRYKGLPHRERLSTLWAYKRFILPRTGVRFIPVVHTPDDVVLQDSTEIIDELERRHPQRSVLPDTPAQKLVALLFELYGNEWFLLPAMHYRWTYAAKQERYLRDEFGRVGGAWLPGPLRRALGAKLSAPFRGSLVALGITEQTVPAIEAWFESFLADFEAHLAEHAYLLGDRPCIGDFALVGPLAAHLARDPSSRGLLEARAPRMLDWIERLHRVPQPEGSFLEADVIPDSLLPILRHLFDEHWPILIDTARQLPAWRHRHPGRLAVSRAIASHRYRIGTVEEERLVFPHAQWMMQRPLDHYRSLDAAERDAADRLLRACGGYEAMQFRPPVRLERRDNRLVIASSTQEVP